MIHGVNVFVWGRGKKNIGEMNVLDVEKSMMQ
jgi:hypothetical protein